MSLAVSRDGINDSEAVNDACQSCSGHFSFIADSPSIHPLTIRKMHNIKQTDEVRNKVCYPDQAEVRKYFKFTVLQIHRLNLNYVKLNCVKLSKYQFKQVSVKLMMREIDDGRVMFKMEFKAFFSKHSSQSIVLKMLDSKHDS